MAQPSTSVPDPALTEQTKLKHRACDECRTRKLACSKDPSGCVRCKKEKIPCHYSEQKPMGRPRKRQIIETEETPIDVLGTGSTFFAPEGLDAANVEPYYTTGQSSKSIHEFQLNNGGSKLDDGRVVWHFGDSEIVAGPPIDFGSVQLDIGNPDIGTSYRPMPSLNTIPDLSTPLNHSNYSIPSTNSSSPQTTMPCSCLASMYLALASLQQLPSDIASVLKTVRDAALTARESIWCPQCGAVVLDNPNPPIEAFQNTMLLGTILPIIANGYQTILKMIDDETDAAIAAGQTKTFRFLDYGGLSHHLRDVQPGAACAQKELSLNAVEMQPQNWRNTVRALLRVDIYGHESGGFKHQGLRDIIVEMEGRQRKRHELVDASILAGTMATGAFGQKICPGEQSHGCLQILEMAKSAIDNLNIT